MIDTPHTDYLGFLFNLPNVDWQNLLSYFLLGLFRIGPIVSVAPFLGAKLPGGVKTGLALSLVFIFLPQIILTSHSVVAFDMAFVGYSLKEIFIGFALAFLAAIPFYIVQGSGSLIDFMRGSSSLQVQDPLLQTQTSPIGILFNYILVVIFFELGGPFIFLNAVNQSFQLIPVDQGLPSAFFNSSLLFWKNIAGLLTKITAVSMQIAAPPIVAVLMAEMFLGIANRLAPQVQIVFLGMSLKSLLGLGLLWAGWLFILQQMGHQALSWTKSIDAMIRSFNI